MGQKSAIIWLVIRNEYEGQEVVQARTDKKLAQTAADSLEAQWRARIEAGNPALKDQITTGFEVRRQPLLLDGRIML